MNDKNTVKKEEIKFADSLLFEGMTSISAIINSPASNDRKIVKVMYDSSKEKSKKKELDFLRRKAKELSFEMEAVSADQIDTVTVGSSHGGIIAICTDRTIPNLSESADDIDANGFYVMLVGIEDPYNFGYALRSLYAAGADGVILSPRNWMGAAGVVARASAGASEMLPMFIDRDYSCAEILKNKGYKIVCAGIRNSQTIYEADMKKPLLLVIGGEKRGISASLLSKADSIVRIDYASSFRGSLSAASSAAIIGFEVMHQNS